ncbi:MAG: DUF5011 domain-containing protein, partial [Ekhidna sp.]|nr:DUF5011 domain-containing protein [Ekhidna sp.]
MKRAVLFLAIGAVSLFSCNNDDDESLPDAPVAVFDASVNGAAVTLTNSSTGTIDSYAWDFGDGTTSTQKSPGPKSYTKTGEYTITLTVTNKGGSDKASKKVNVTVAVADTEAPVITLNGNLGADFDIQLGADYQDAGATATDNVDGTLTVTVGGDMVNTNEAGTYVITYDVSDAAGNAATRVTRTVRVRYPSGLVTNGDFQGSSTSPWFVNFPDAGNTANNTVPTETAATNTFFNAANITADANGQAFTVNLSQVIQIEQGKTYQLSFDASSDMNRSIIAGIGLNGGSFASSTQNVNITTTTTRYMLNLAANFVEMGTDNRVLFDLAGEDGTVVLDNIALAEVTPTEMPSTALSAPTDAPTDPPMRDAANVISIYGEAYGAATGLSNVTWDGSTAFAEETIAGNKVLKVNFDTFLGTSLGSKVDASGMSHFHMDFWIADDFA